MSDIDESSITGGRLVGNRGDAFRKSATSRPDEWRDRKGTDVGARRNAGHENAAVDKARDSEKNRLREIEKRNKEAQQRQKETVKMAQEENDEVNEVRLLKPTKTFDRTALNTALAKHNDDMKKLRAEISAAKKAKAAAAKKKPVSEEEVLESLESSKVDPQSKHRATVHYATTWQKDLQKKTYKINKDTSDDIIKRHHHKLFGGRIDKIERHVSEEASGTAERVKIKNVARPDDAAPTSSASKLTKQAEIKNKVVDEGSLFMSDKNFGLPASLIEAAKAIVEKKDDGLTGGKTKVDLKPETNDKVDDDGDDKPKNKKLDPVGKEDDDVDNDGDSDKSDKYLKNRRKAISKAMKEDVEQIDELKKSTLASYANKAADDATKYSYMAGKTGDVDKAAKASKRIRGIMTATKKMSEDIEQVDEVLSKKAPAGEWIKDFQKSDNPKFDRKSPEKRKQMALAAYYAKQRNEEVEEVDEARSKEGYQTWPGQKKKAFFTNKAMSDETAKWKARKDAERAEREAASKKKTNEEFSEEEIARLEEIAKKFD